MILELLVRREHFTTESTIGRLYIDGSDAEECFTLEDEDRALESGGVKIYGRTAIPRGRYKVALDWSPKYGRDMPHILDVPGYTGVRIHSGNKSADTEGCLLVGQERHENYIRNSKPAFDALLRKMNLAWSGGKEVWITIV